MRSRGVFEYKTEPTDFGRIGSQVRLLCEQGRINELRIDTAETMVASNASYSEEMYKISCRVFGSATSTFCKEGDKLHEEITARGLTIHKMSRRYELAVKEGVDMGNYEVVSEFEEYYETESYANRIFVLSGYTTVPAWTFLFNEGKLYVRKFFLRSFNTGLNILNVLYVQKKVREQREKHKNCLLKIKRKLKWDK